MVTSARKLTAGSTVARRDLTPLEGPPVSLPEPGRLVHLQFRRFAGCPICHLHLRSVVNRHQEIEAAGIREVVLFHAPEQELRKHTEGLPFAVVADPGKRLYVEFGVETSWRSVLDPRVWPSIVKAVAYGLWGLVRGRFHAPAPRPSGGRLGLPADLLIADDGTVVAAKYGEHADDQWSVDGLLAHAAEHRGWAVNSTR